VSEPEPAYHRTLPLSTEQLEQMCSPRVYRLACRYAQSAHVTDRMRIGAALTARFHGTRGVYDTRLDVAKRQCDFECTCPLAGAREPCKHVIALGVTWIHDPDSFHDLDATLARLTKASKAELITLLRHVAGRMPALVPLLGESRD